MRCRLRRATRSTGFIENPVALPWYGWPAVASGCAAIISPSRRIAVVRLPSFLPFLSSECPKRPLPAVFAFRILCVRRTPSTLWQVRQELQGYRPWEPRLEHQPVRFRLPVFRAKAAWVHRNVVAGLRFCVENTRPLLTRRKRLLPSTTRSLSLASQCSLYRRNTSQPLNMKHDNSDVVAGCDAQWRTLLCPAWEIFRDRAVADGVRGFFVIPGSRGVRVEIRRWRTTRNLRSSGHMSEI
jgi:hypothetical protein